MPLTPLPMFYADLFFAADYAAAATGRCLIDITLILLFSRIIFIADTSATFSALLR